MELNIKVTTIENGYLLEEGLDLHLGGMGNMKKYYAADATGIAELIVAAAARQKIGVGEQIEMPLVGGVTGKAAQKHTNDAMRYAVDNIKLGGIHD